MKRLPGGLNSHSLNLWAVSGAADAMACPHPTYLCGVMLGLTHSRNRGRHAHAHARTHPHTHARALSVSASQVPHHRCVDVVWDAIGAGRWPRPQRALRRSYRHQRPDRSAVRPTTSPPPPPPASLLVSLPTEQRISTPKTSQGGGGERERESEFWRRVYVCAGGLTCEDA